MGQHIDWASVQMLLKNEKKNYRVLASNETWGLERKMAFTATAHVSWSLSLFVTLFCNP